MLQLLTCTGARPEAFKLCQEWMRRQDFAGKVIWFIIDDGPQPTRVEKMPPNWLQVVVRRAPFWEPGQNTQAENLRRGMAVVDRGLPLVMIEDDDWYAPDWLSFVAAQLEHAELVGEGLARYYNVATKVCRQLGNNKHASLCSTALRGSAYLTLDGVLRRSSRKFIDMELWKRQRSKRVFEGHRVVGMKGLPGRGGIGMGHDENFSGHADPDGSLLRQWIGEDAKTYEVM